MGVLYNIQEKIGYSILNNRIKKHKRERAFSNFDSARSVGVLFNAADENELKISKDFIFSFKEKGIDVSALGFVSDSKVIPNLPYHRGVNYFPIGEKTWYMKPTDPAVGEFAERNFDILIDLNLSDKLSLRYIVGISKAKLKIGADNSTYKDYYDLTIDISKKNNLRFFIDQVNYYMGVIKAAQSKN